MKNLDYKKQNHTKIGNSSRRSTGRQLGFNSDMGVHDWKFPETSEKLQTKQKNGVPPTPSYTSQPRAGTVATGGVWGQICPPASMLPFAD